MKVLFTFLALFLLCLSCLPCSDSNECNVKAEVKISSTADHQEHNHDKESCTPFCSCSCCAISAFYSPFFKTLATKLVKATEKYPLFDVAVRGGVHYSIWQPPKKA